MTWKSKLGKDFEDLYNNNSESKSLFDFAIALILHSKDPRGLPLTIPCPSSPNNCMLNLQNTHAIIFRIDYDTNGIEFIFCN